MQTPLSQTMPQSPQLFGSVFGSTQESTVAPHWRGSAAGQLVRTHSPPRQATPTRLLSHTAPQSPQLPISVRRSTHVPPQSVNPVSQPPWADAGALRAGNPAAAPTV